MGGGTAGGGGGRGDPGCGGGCGTAPASSSHGAGSGAEPQLVAADRMGPGDHACLGFSGHDDRWAVRAAFTLAGFARGERVVIFTGRGTSAPEALDRLTAHGVPAERFVHSGQLTLSQGSPGYDPVTGAFDPAARTAVLAAGSAESRRRGFTGMRVAADMAWAAGLAPGELASYEADLTPRFARTGFTAICEYDRAVFPAPLLDRMTAVHPLAVLPSVDAFHADRAGPRLRLVGTADLATRTDVTLALRAAFATDPPPTHLDLTPLSFLDAHCAAALLRLPPPLTLHCTPAQHRILHICDPAALDHLTIEVTTPR
ncbi:MEDS domain-containing protein [Actinacidiphila alni]|uniref:MEDS domain-containing protein n=1 Tax=Actinacidiphila alni TaxID=380248 RepID=UPI0034564401